MKFYFAIGFVVSFIAAIMVMAIRRVANEPALDLHEKMQTVNHYGLERYENDEVVCYIENGRGISCRWKQ